jgi:hypothetical protein
MNKLAYIVAASALVVSAFGQGSVNVNNRGLTPAQLVTDTAGNNLSTLNGAFVAQLVYGANGSTPATVLGGTMPFRVSTSSFVGTWNPGAEGIRTLTGFDTGAAVAMQVRVWDSAVFTSWDAASAALTAGSHSVATQAGSSSVFTYTVGAASDPSSQSIVNFRGFQLTAIPVTVVPEPTTIALGALGAAALLWRRRK